MKDILNYSGGLIGFLTLFWYAIGVWTKKTPPITPASFFMWSILDVMLLANTIANGHPPFLTLGWTIGAIMVTAALFKRGKWQWTFRETLSATAATIAFIVWCIFDNVAGCIGLVLAMNISGAPNYYDMCINPVRKSWPVWFFNGLATLLTAFGSDISVTGLMLPVCSVTYNFVLAAIVLRGK